MVVKQMHQLDQIKRLDIKGTPWMFCYAGIPFSAIDHAVLTPSPSILVCSASTLLIQIIERVQGIPSTAD